MTREDYFDGIANNMLLQKWIVADKNFDQANFSKIAATIYPKHTMEIYEIRKEKMNEQFKS